MLFNSFSFLLFFPVVTILYFIIPYKWRWLHLLLASCVFYMAFIPVYIFILLFTIVVDYFAGIFIEVSRGRKRKFFLITSIVANISILAIFKYYNFFVENINALFHLSAANAIPYLSIILPIGLSFHTFQAMSYTIEVYRGKQAAERHFGIYALYVMFYPQLVAGPIERPQNLLWQFRIKHEYKIDRIYEGLKLMLWGLFKKVVIADRLALYVNDVYGNYIHWEGANYFLATIFFAFQIYCDFSGYSDMAIGSAKVMGFHLMTNFNRPYFAKDIQEFWKRWHISLSTWFRDYVYIPLGGNRGTKTRVYLNVAIVFLLSGFWHGANWNFIIWGGIHAVLIIAYMVYKEYSGNLIGDKNRFLNLLGMILTFFCVCIGWIFFRAADAGQAITMLKGIIHADWSSFRLNISTGDVPFGTTSAVISLFMIAVLLLNEKFQNVQQLSLNARPVADILYNAAILCMVIVFGVFQKTSFIYFQF
ncbi:MAG: MBOAT family protein [Chitinophagaceae bacterium]|nr:MBOAT family protein [Chitinophagaceae bacterium]